MIPVKYGIQLAGEHRGHRLVHAAPGPRRPVPASTSASPSVWTAIAIRSRSPNRARDLDRLAAPRRSPARDLPRTERRCDSTIARYPCSTPSAGLLRVALRPQQEPGPDGRARSRTKCSIASRAAAAAGAELVAFGRVGRVRLVAGVERLVESRDPPRRVGEALEVAPGQGRTVDATEGVECLGPRPARQRLARSIDPAVGIIHAVPSRTGGEGSRVVACAPMSPRSVA